MALSLLMFTGGSQFAFVGIVATGLQAAPAAIAASSMLGIRNGLCALELTQLLGVRGVRRLAAAHLTIDESTAVAVAQEDQRMVREGLWCSTPGWSRWASPSWPCSCARRSSSSSYSALRPLRPCARSGG